MANPASVPHLMAMAHDVTCEGLHRCFYCSAPCGEDYPASVYVKDSFTGRNEVPAPGSAWVCPGCVICLSDEGEIAMIDGELRYATRCRMRGYSWVVTADRALAATKAHLAALRALCLDPPPPPWAIVLSDSGQKHLLYRGAVNRDPGGPFVVTLEAERVEYFPHSLAWMLEIAGRYCAATGKPALSEPISFNAAMRVTERYPESGEMVLEDWGRSRSKPIGRLAAWLCGSRESCIEEYPPDVVDPDH